MRTLQRAFRSTTILAALLTSLGLAACQSDDDGDDGGDDSGDSGADSGDDGWDSGDGDGDGSTSSSSSTTTTTTTTAGDSGDSGDDPSGECCSLFDCPGTEVQCECGTVSGCFIQSGECGTCITEADCAAYCAQNGDVEPFSVAVIE